MHLFVCLCVCVYALVCVVHVHVCVCQIWRGVHVIRFLPPPVLPSSELLQPAVQAAADGDSTTEQPGGALPPPQLPQP